MVSKYDLCPSAEVPVDLGTGFDTPRRRRSATKTQVMSQPAMLRRGEGGHGARTSSFAGAVSRSGGERLFWRADELTSVTEPEGVSRSPVCMGSEADRSSL